MAAPTLEEMAERVAALEATMARIERRNVVRLTADSKIPWWKRRSGAFKDSTHYDEAMRLAEEYRKLQPLDGEDF